MNKDGLISPSEFRKVCISTNCFPLVKYYVMGLCNGSVCLSDKIYGLYAINAFKISENFSWIMYAELKF